jgi:hypothetical protein
VEEKGRAATSFKMHVVSPGKSLVPVCGLPWPSTSYSVSQLSSDGGVSNWRLRLSWRPPVYLLSPSASSFCPMSSSLPILLGDLEDESRPDLALVAEGGGPVSQQNRGRGWKDHNE